MKLINAYLLALTLCFAGVATADHKPGHPPPAPEGVAGLVRILALSIVDPATVDGQGLSTVATQEAFAECPAGKKVLGGGYYFPYGGPTVPIRTNVPTVDRDGFLVDGTNIANTPWRLAAVAMCADAQ